MGLRRGRWAAEEDKILSAYIERNGHSNWRTLPHQAGLQRCGKSCRLRWLNYLRPDIKRGNFTREEEDAIIHLHQKLGNRWSAIAVQLPGRTDNEIKNVWHTNLKKSQLASSSSSSSSSSSTTPTPCPLGRDRKRSRQRHNNKYLRRDMNSPSTTCATNYPSPNRNILQPMPSSPIPPPQPACYCSSSSYNNQSDDTTLVPPPSSSSRNHLESPTSTVINTTPESDYLADEILTEFQPGDQTGTISKLNINDNAYSNPSGRLGLIQHVSQQKDDNDKEEDVSYFWLRLLMEADKSMSCHA